MNALFDTHLMLWAMTGDQRLGPAAREAILDPSSAPWFSTASIWEIAIKFARRKPDFGHAPGEFHAALLQRGWRELGIKVEHVIATATLPRIHDDPFDRLLAAQASVEGLVLVTADQTLARYPHTLRLA